MGARDKGPQAQYHVFCVVWLYNPLRRHSALGYVSPEQYERAYDQRAKAQNLAAQERSTS